MSAYTIIVPDGQTLRRLCGTNDTNLRLIESRLGAEIFASGNEIAINSENNECIEQFRFVIDRILDEFSENQSNFSDSDIVRSVLAVDKGKSHFGNISIEIPGGIKKIYPYSAAQAKLIEAFKENDVVFAVGSAGSGKTYLAVATALSLVLSKQKSALVLTRPVVEAGESLGYLPGDLEEKINPYIRPLYDAMNAVLPRESVKKLTESGIVEAAPLAYMRGRTISNSIILLDEAQNTSVGQMKMFLTRMGEGSKMFVTGDLTQIDLPKHIPSGLLHATKILKDVPGIYIQELQKQDVVRSATVKRIIQAYEDEERKN